MTVCVSCLDDRTWLRAEHRANVKREERGKPPVLTEIRRVKQKMADCAARGHHDAQAGPASRYGRKLADAVDALPGQISESVGDAISRVTDS